MDYNLSKIDDAVLALLAIFSFGDDRAWKGFDFDVMNRLHAEGLIENPVGKNKSVRLTPEGLQRGQKLAASFFKSESGDAD